MLSLLDNFTAIISTYPTTLLHLKTFQRMSTSHTNVKKVASHVYGNICLELDRLPMFVLNVASTKL